MAGSSPAMTKSSSPLLQRMLDLALGPAFAERAHAHPGSVIGIDQRVRGEFIVDIEQPQFGGRQPAQGIIDIAGENLPRRAIVEFDEMAFGVLRDFHGLNRFLRAYLLSG